MSGIQQNENHKNYAARFFGENILIKALLMLRIWVGC